MAIVRISALPNESTNPAPTDFLAVDGPGGTKKVTLSNLLASTVSIPTLESIGGNGDGAFDNTTVVGTAEATGDAYYNSKGTYLTTIDQAALNGPFFGQGQVQDSAGNRRAPVFTAIRAEPTRGTYGSILTQFNGDVSKVPLCIEHRVYGATTLGTPASAYLYTPEASPEYSGIFNTAGHNQSTSTNDGRTMLAGKYMTLAHSGQGDMYGYIVSGVVTSTKPGSTNFLANPAIGVFGGGLFAGVAGAMLNLSETHLVDNGFDSSLIGHHTVIRRTNGTGAKSAVALGDLVSSIDAEHADVAYIAKGRFKVGLDLSGLLLKTPNNAAIALPPDGAIYFNSTQPASGNTAANWYATSVGSQSLYWSTSANAFIFQIGANPTFQISATGVVAYQVPFNAVSTGAGFSFNSVPVVGARKTGWTAATGTATRSTFATGSVTLPVLAEHVKALLDDLISHGLIGT